MARRASLPGADELFRPTTPAEVTPLHERRPESAASAPKPASVVHDVPASRIAAEIDVGDASGRVKHDTKITVYLSNQELLDLEQTRLRLRADFDIAVDRGRIVREAISEFLQDLRETGPDAAIVRRLS